ncbi:hypothetical protein HF295_06810 [Hujiaoplasma nucleasis]|uniref:SRPBCC domain-containing protein n=1 Tax=Hujiaoplasma nucleasis TaxID=2725268 RepID=A0A7L6N508_9MOLU|nr:hypothetical protein [Hujiaoplasma nucleasis]QLY40572.1 hypothetical protein HF295_06810 [Hujiaoplasma nucleasis]
MSNIIEYSIHTYLKGKVIWKILFDNHYVKEYMGCLLRKNKESMTWYIEKDLREIVLLEGEIIEETPNEYIHIRTYNPHRHYDKKYTLDVFYILKDHTLTIKQTGFENLPDGQKVYEENKLGWAHSINELNKIIDKKEK